MMDRDEAYRISLQQIRSGDVSAACRTVADYELSQPQPRGLFSGISPQEYWARYPEPSDIEILESIFSETLETPDGISDDDLNAARIIAAFNFVFCPICENTSKSLHTNTHGNLTINRMVCIITHMADVPCFERRRYN